MNKLILLSIIIFSLLSDISTATTLSIDRQVILEGDLLDSVLLWSGTIPSGQSDENTAFLENNGSDGLFHEQRSGFLYDIQWDTGEYSWQELQDIPVNVVTNFSYTLNSDNNDHGFIAVNHHVQNLGSQIFNDTVVKGNSSNTVEVGGTLRFGDIGMYTGLGSRIDAGSPGKVISGNLTINSLKFEFDHLPGESFDHPLLPDEISESGFIFDITVDGSIQDEPIYIDPVVAIGYEYTMLSDNSFDSVLLPTGIGNEIYEILTWNDSLNAYDPTTISILGGIEYFFNSEIKKFKVLGIEASAGLDPDDELAFVTGLTFSQPGSIQLSQNPITLEISNTTVVPEPATMMLFGIGLLILSGINRRKKQTQY